jgi:hypothetical protein
VQYLDQNTTKNSFFEETPDHSETRIGIQYPLRLPCDLVHESPVSPQTTYHINPARHGLRASIKEQLNHIGGYVVARRLEGRVGEWDRIRRTASRERSRDSTVVRQIDQQGTPEYATLEHARFGWAEHALHHNLRWVA